jgi:hypothetical protein
MKDACAWTAYRVRLPTINARKAGLETFAQACFMNTACSSLKWLTQLLWITTRSPTVKYFDTGAWHYAVLGRSVVIDFWLVLSAIRASSCEPSPRAVYVLQCADGAAIDPPSQIPPCWYSQECHTGTFSHASACAPLLPIFALVTCKETLMFSR